MTRLLTTLALLTSLLVPHPPEPFRGHPAPTLERRAVKIVREPHRASRSATRSDDALWDRLAACESGGRWHLNTGAFDGGLQFHPGTWASVVRRYRLPFPRFAWQASREQQIMAARIVLREQGWQAWPGCSHRLHLRRSGR